MRDMQREILDQIKKLRIHCPDCSSIDDDQYTCTTCWSSKGKINVWEWIKENWESIKDAKQ